MDLQFRAATIDDIPAVRELIAASVRTLQVEYTPRQRELALTTVFTVDTQLVVDGTYLLAFSDEGRLAGCGGWSKRKTLFGGDQQVGRIEPELLDPAVDAAKIRAIFIHPEFARKSLGSAILKRAEDAATAYGFRSFEMGSTLAGVPLYSLKGYHKLDEVSVPISDGEAITIVRMMKRLEA